MSITRRTLLKALTKLAAVSALPTIGGYGYASQLEAEWLVVERVSVPIRNLPEALGNFKIVHMSDFHLYPFTALKLIRRAVEIASALKPDLVCLTGDYVLDNAEAVFDLAPALGKLNAKYGIFSVMGNHDIWTNRIIIEQGFKASGITTLCNSGVPIGVGKDILYLAGVDDCWSGKHDLSAALEAAPKSGVGVLLAHEPDFADVFSLDSRIALQLSGHTHGGQVRIPGAGAIILPPHGRKYDCGLQKVREMWVYTTRGVGVIGPPVRFNCRPEITEILLSSA